MGGRAVTREFKLEAVKLVRERGVSAANDTPPDGIRSYRSHSSGRVHLYSTRTERQCGEVPHQCPMEPGRSVRRDLKR
jgi:hypothetical protein